MLQLRTENAEIVQISKLLATYNVQASISNQLINLKGYIPEELIEKLCREVKILSVCNFDGELTDVLEETNECVQEEIFDSEFEVTEDQITTEESSVAEGYDNESVQSFGEEIMPQEVVPPVCIERKGEQLHTTEHDLVFPKVSRGEIYSCDFGEPYGHEQGETRPAIIIQNDVGNKYSPTTIVVPCSTRGVKRDRLPVHFRLFLNPQTVADFNPSGLDSREANTIFCEQIRAVDKRRLRTYLGRLNSELMSKLQTYIDASLDLDRNYSVKRDVKGQKISLESVEIVVGTSDTEENAISTELYEDTKDSSENQFELPSFNDVQVSILNLINIGEFESILRSSENINNKIEKTLKLFGFNLKKNGMEYLSAAIRFSLKLSYFTMDDLAMMIAQKYSVSKEEVQRLIVARVKETFKFKKSPAIDFIRLVNYYLK